MPDLAIDTFRTLPDGSPNPNYGNMYEVWTRYYPAGQFPGEPDSTAGSDIMIAVSQDGGQTWQTPARDAAGHRAAIRSPSISRIAFDGDGGCPDGQGYRGSGRT